MGKGMQGYLSSSYTTAIKNHIEETDRFVTVEKRKADDAESNLRMERYLKGIETKADKDFWKRSEANAYKQK